MASSTTPSAARLHDNLIELYTNNTSSPNRHASNDNDIRPNQQQRHVGTNASISSTSVSLNSADSKKKKSRRRFLPLVTKRHESSSESSVEEEHSRQRRERRGRSSHRSSTNGSSKQTQQVNGASAKIEQRNGNPVSATTGDTKQISAHHIFQSALGQRISREYQSQLSTFHNNQQKSQVNLL